MKKIIAFALVSTMLGACASNPSSDSDMADANSGPKTKRVCETVRTNQTGARLRRVCRDVLVDDSAKDAADES